MKLSVSLPDEDVAFLDEYAQMHGYGSRSAVLQKAVRLLNDAELANAYVAAWIEWQGSEEDGAWDVASADGLHDE